VAATRLHYITYTSQDIQTEEKAWKLQVQGVQYKNRTAHKCIYIYTYIYIYICMCVCVCVYNTHIRAGVGNDMLQISEMVDFEGT